MDDVDLAITDQLRSLVDLRWQRGQGPRLALVIGADVGVEHTLQNHSTGTRDMDERH